MSRRTLATVIGALLILFGALTFILLRDGTEGRRRGAGTAAPQGTSEVISSGRCANEEAVALDEERRGEGSLEGDIDGDSNGDEAFVAFDVDGTPEKCRAFLVIRRSDGIWSLPIGNPATPYDLGYPRHLGVFPESAIPYGLLNAL